MLLACSSCTRTYPVRSSLQTTLIPADFAAAQVDFVPHSLRDVKLQKSEVAWHDIGGASSLLTTLMSAGRGYHFGHSQLTCALVRLFPGLRETKRVLRETLEWPTKYGPIFAQSPLRLRSGYATAFALFGRSGF